MIHTAGHLLSWYSAMTSANLAYLSRF